MKQRSSEGTNYQFNPVNMFPILEIFRKCTEKQNLVPNLREIKCENDNKRRYGYHLAYG
jgi:hypothetical protein